MARASRSTSILRKCRTGVVLGLLVSVGSLAVAQEVPEVPSAPPIPTATPAPATGFIGKCTSCIGSLGSMVGGCAKGCCNTPLGKLINGAFQPIEMATGGVIPAPCPGPNDPSKHGAAGSNTAAGGAPGPQAAAQAIKKDQAQAKARCEAVKYLATVPCHYYPEAEAALIQALRMDRSECVRWEAAHALTQGCCCTKKTIAALKIVVSGSQQDGNPSEKSFRVKVEALNALEHCLSMCGSVGEPQRPEMPSPMPQPETIPTPLPQPARPELPMGEGDGSEAASGVQQANYYEEVEKQSSASVVADARRLVESAKLSAKNTVSPRRGNSLMEIWRRSDRSDEVAEAEPETAVGPVRAELPGETAAAAHGRPTLAPPGSQASVPNMPVDGRVPMVGPPPVGEPYAYQLTMPVAPAQAHVPSYGNTASSPETMVAPQATPPVEESWPTLSLPPYETTESLSPEASRIQTLPPLEALPDAIASPGMGPPMGPGQLSRVIGSQRYLYPSTNSRAGQSSQPTQVAQQPEWANPQPRR